ncbi:IclR family transcriptional regulator [Klenkia terrae]|uniref:IclR family transcriptional regulator n=1 Tax=Klenkia terrae TaxID=1052259 RepID=UPI00360CF45C
MQAELRQVASPFLLDVHTATRDTVHLAVRDGPTALYVDRVSGRESVPVVSQVGSRLPLHAVGVGKVLLAAAPDEVVEQVLRSLDRQTRHTVVEPARLARELAEVRRTGWARTSEEMSLGAASVAVPVTVVRGSGGRAVVAAALGIVVPTHRAERDLPRLVPVLEVAARGIGRELARTEEFR